MGWRNEGRQGHVTWRRGWNPPGVCHHGNCWRDWAALTARKRAAEKALWKLPYRDLVVKPYWRCLQGLDVGAGDGQWVPMLKRFALDVWATDLAQYGDAVQVIADAEELPFRDQQFGVALAATVIAHVEDQLSCLRELTRVADHVLIVDMTPKVLPRWAFHLPHRRPMSQTELDMLMHAHGMTRVARHGCGFIDSRLFHRTPEWAWPAAAIFTWAVDLLVRRPARYYATLYSRGTT